MEGLFAAIITIGTLVFLFAGFQWIMAKFFGTHFHGKFQASEALQNQQEYERIFDQYVQSNPAIVNEAVARCKSKGYSKTHYNILAEIRKIEMENSAQPNLKEKISQKIKKFREELKVGKYPTDIEKLERLNDLRLSGGLTDEEYRDLKLEILKEKSTTSPSSNVVNTSKANNVSVDVIQEQRDWQIKEALKTINMLYFEFKDELECLENLELKEVHDAILKNENSISLINNYDNLFKLYSDGIITKEEFVSKKKKIVINSLKV